MINVWVNIVLSRARFFARNILRLIQSSCSNWKFYWRWWFSNLRLLIVVARAWNLFCFLYYISIYHSLFFCKGNFITRMVSSSTLKRNLFKTLSTIVLSRPWIWSLLANLALIMFNRVIWWSTSFFWHFFLIKSFLKKIR